MRKFTVVLLIILMVLPQFALAQEESVNLMRQNEKVADMVINGLWNGEDIDVVYAVYADPFVAHSPANDDTMDVAPEFWRELIGVDFRRAFPDMVVIVENMVATEDTVMVHYTFQGTYSGPLSSRPNEPPTGELETWDGVFIFRLEDGMIVEEWWYWVNAAI